jgi:acetyl-CoA carboxylase biotin carboxyl carrier protein
MASLDFKLVRHALDLAKQNGMQEVELEIGDSKFSAVLEKSKRIAPQQSKSVSESSSQPESIAKTKSIRSTSVGIFRTVGEMLKVGTQIASSEVVGNIVALGISNDVISGINGVITEVLVEDGQAVEYGQTIAVVELA